MTEDARTIENQVAEFIAKELGDAISMGLRNSLDIEWAPEEEGDVWPWVVEHDGRKFELDIDVTVTELTRKVLHQRQMWEQQFAPSPTSQPAEETPQA